MIVLSSNKSWFSLANLWVMILLLSFSYDKPILTIFSADRFNPRLIDLAFVLGIIWYLKVKRTFKIKNPVYIYYKKLIIVFAVCTIASFIIYDYPLLIKGYSFYYLFKYIQELLICFLFIQFLLNYRINYETILKLLIFGGVFVFLYSLNEYFNPILTEVEIAPGKFIPKPAGLIWGPFTVSYFQIANYSPIISFIALTYGLNNVGTKRITYVILAGLISFPSFVSGSRTAIGFIFVLLFLASLKNKKYRAFMVGFVLITILFLLFNYDFFVNLIFNDNHTIERLQRMENNNTDFEYNSILGRFLHLFYWFEKIPDYIYNGVFLPIFGGGFYVSPIDGLYRIGYGWHNIFIFAIEQAGIVGFIFFIKFLKKTYKILNKSINILLSRAEETIVFSTKIIFTAILVLGILGAHSFWQGFATGNFNTMRLLLFIISSHIIIEKMKNNEQGECFIN